MDGLHQKATNYEGKAISIKFITDNNQMLEAVGYYVSETDSILRVRHLQAIVPQQGQNAVTGKPEMQVGFMHFMLSGEPGEITDLYKHTIAAVHPAKSEVVKELEKIDSPITVEQKKIII